MIHLTKVTFLFPNWLEVSSWVYLIDHVNYCISEIYWTIKIKHQRLVIPKGTILQRVLHKGTIKRPSTTEPVPADNSTNLLTEFESKLHSVFYHCISHCVQGSDLNSFLDTGRTLPDCSVLWIRHPKSPKWLTFQPKIIEVYQTDLSPLPDVHTY